MSKKRTYEGTQVDVEWDGDLCIHIGECGRAKGELFQGGRDPWCEPDVTDAESVAAVVLRCPTGALTYKRKDGGSDEQAAASNTVVVANNGPLYASGDLAIEGFGEGGVRFRAALCRCGASKNKPFCDNSHEKAGFVDRGAIGEEGDGTSVESGSKPLSITPLDNGPLLVAGPCTLVTGSGRAAWRGTKAALCRCGASKNKPFCDGAHKAAGFKSD